MSTESRKNRYSYTLDLKTLPFGVDKLVLSVPVSTYVRVCKPDEQGAQGELRIILGRNRTRTYSTSRVKDQKSFSILKDNDGNCNAQDSGDEFFDIGDFLTKVATTKPQSHRSSHAVGVDT